MRKIRIHDEQDVAARLSESCEDGGGEAGLPGPAQNADRMNAGVRGGEVRGAVGRAVVDDDQLPRVRRERRRESWNELA
jgi:hypothetical protein